MSIFYKQNWCRFNPLFSMYAKVQTEFYLLNVSLKCWQLSIWGTTAEIIYEICQQWVNNRLHSLSVYGVKTGSHMFLQRKCKGPNGFFLSLKCILYKK